MKKLALILVAAGFVITSCSGGGKDAPRNLDNACSIKKQRKSWFKELERTERKWGVPVPVMMATIYQESKFKGDARTPYKWKAKVIPMAWDEYRKDQGRRGAKRNDFGDAVDFMGWYMDLSNQRNGIAKNDAYNQYLAYHDGHAGFRRGTYRRKAWLVRVAGTVQSRAIMYDSQLARCR